MTPEQQRLILGHRKAWHREFERRLKWWATMHHLFHVAEYWQGYKDALRQAKVAHKAVNEVDNDVEQPMQILRSLN